ncbi:hypothetical protein [Bradyrhizobium sp. Ce-3]|uniref:hypothetical protein n=1 Tax=Bradyrhizobium sp. Ce-3 TaxID=2913970 RepID=UPI001FC7CF4D|nr:hypothetical protein [Bradyrhizobium sp. Ce-3]
MAHADPFLSLSRKPQKAAGMIARTGEIPEREIISTQHKMIHRQIPTFSKVLQLNSVTALQSDPDADPAPRISARPGGHAGYTEPSSIGD